jgi:hypothetical protein
MKEVLTREERTERIMEIYDKLDAERKKEFEKIVVQVYLEGGLCNE